MTRKKTFTDCNALQVLIKTDDGVRQVVLTQDQKNLVLKTIQLSSPDSKIILLDEIIKTIDW